MTDIDISEWPENHFISYITNHLVDKQNKEVMNNATNTVLKNHAVDGRADDDTGAFQCNLSDTNIAKTGNMKKILKLWVDARVPVLKIKTFLVTIN